MNPKSIQIHTMATHRKDKTSIVPRQRLHVPSTAISTAYTTAYMTVEPLSPPSSSQPSSSLELSHRRVNARASAEQGTSTVQTMRLVKVLNKRKALLYACLVDDKAEEDEDCKTIMQDISEVVNDSRFRTWSKVKSWTKTQHRKWLKRSPQVLRPSAKKRTSTQLGILFSKLVPVLNTSRMNINARKFFDSVLDTFGSDKLKRTFSHHLTRDELPDDIGALIFSPLFWKLYKTQTHIADDDQSDWADEDELTEDEDSNDPNHSIPRLSSIELGHDGRDVSMTVTSERNDELSTTFPSLVENQELEIRGPQSSNHTDWRNEEDYMVNFSSNKGRYGSHGWPSPPYQNLNVSSASTRWLAPSEAQDQAIGNTRVRDESDWLSPLGPCIRPFSDIMSPGEAVVSGTRTEPLTQISTLPHVLSDPFNDEDVNERVSAAPVAVCSDGGNGSKRASDLHHGSNITGGAARKREKHKRRRLNRLMKKATASPSASSYPRPVGASEPSAASLTSRTPEILIAENLRHDRKLEKPLAPKIIPNRDPAPKKLSPVKTRRAHEEIWPPGFYNPLPLIRDGAQITRESMPSGPDLDVPGTRMTMSRKEDRENRVEEPCAMRPNSLQLQLDSTLQSYSSDDDISFTSVEEIYQRAKRQARTQTTRSSAASITAATTGTKENNENNTYKRRGANRSPKLARPPIRDLASLEIEHDRRTEQIQSRRALEAQNETPPRQAHTVQGGDAARKKLQPRDRKLADNNDHTSLLLPSTPKRKISMSDGSRASLAPMYKSKYDPQDNQPSSRKRNWDNANDNHHLPPLPRPSKRKRQNTTQTLTSVYSGTLNNNGPSSRNTAPREDLPTFPHLSSSHIDPSVSRDQSKLPTHSGQPPTTPKIHASREPLGPPTESSLLVTSRHSTPNNLRKRSESRKPAAGRNIGGRLGHGDRSARAQRAQTVDIMDTKRACNFCRGKTSLSKAHWTSGRGQSGGGTKQARRVH
ncbi:hypothetical protein F5Y19DRAFT_151801 [Xylariaceae sp. FL1651]|nr:hypothetical protein F5Y19DRAFT_151801 [Xylariaceae sp. FL1651]